MTSGTLILYSSLGGKKKNLKDEVIYEKVTNKIRFVKQCTTPIRRTKKRSIIHD